MEKNQIQEALTPLMKECWEIAQSKGFWDNEDNLQKLQDEPELFKAAFNAMVVTKLALVGTEVSEAIEAVRKDKPTVNFEYFQNLLDLKINELETGMRFKGEESFPKNYKDLQKAKIYSEVFEKEVKDTPGDELADAVIRIFDFCYKSGIDLSSHIYFKMKYNASRPSKHNKQF